MEPESSLIDFIASKMDNGATIGEAIKAAEAAGFEYVPRERLVDALRELLSVSTHPSPGSAPRLEKALRNAYAAIAGEAAPTTKAEPAPAEPSEDDCIETYHALTGMHLWTEEAHAEVVRKMRALAARWSATPAAPADAPAGFALVPLRMTPRMDAVLQNDDWQWEDLLAAAEAITLEQHAWIAEGCPRAAPADALDAKRLDWLIAEDNCVVCEGTNGFWLCWLDEHDHSQSEYQAGSYPTARAAIDAAIAAQAAQSVEKEVK